VGYDFQIIKAVHHVNDTQKRLLVDRIRAHFGGDLSGRRFALWGLAFKPRTDDVREAPSLVVIEALLSAGARVSAFDPEAVDNARRVLEDRIDYAANAYQALDGADALVVVTEWNEFRFPDFDRVRSLLKNPVVFDGRNVYDPRRMAAMGFTYYSIGRPSATRTPVSTPTIG
jgi:UDPglucose 6-dehydrogenase